MLKIENRLGGLDGFGAVSMPKASPLLIGGIAGSVVGGLMLAMGQRTLGSVLLVAGLGAAAYGKWKDADIPADSWRTSGWTPSGITDWAGMWAANTEALKTAKRDTNQEWITGAQLDPVKGVRAMVGTSSVQAYV